jgi:hypothetical protein
MLGRDGWVATAEEKRWRRNPGVCCVGLDCAIPRVCGVVISGSREEARCKFMKRKSAVCGGLNGGELMARVPPPPILQKRAWI